MSTPPYTSTTRVALARARGIAAARGDTDLTPTHLAAGIAGEGPSPGMAALWYAGVPEKQITTLSSRLLRMLGEPTGRVQPREVAIGLSPGEEAVTHLAEQEMIRLDDEYLGTEHLLLAMLRAGGDVAQLLADRGVTLESYEAGLAAVRRGDPPPASAVA